MYEKERNVNSENLCEILRVCEGVLTKVPKMDRAGGVGQRKIVCSCT